MLSECHEWMQLFFFAHPLFWLCLMHNMLGDRGCIGCILLCVRAWTAPAVGPPSIFNASYAGNVPPWSDPILAGHEPVPRPWHWLHLDCRE